MLQLISVDSRYFPYPYQARMWASSETISYWKGSWADVDRKCPTFLKEIGCTFFPFHILLVIVIIISVASSGNRIGLKY